MYSIARLLDRLYEACGYVAAAAMVAMLLVILAQIFGRWFGIPFPGATDYAGYLMAAAFFFGLAYAFAHGAHIRVGLLLSRLSGTPRRLAEIWCLVVGGGLAWYFAYYACRAVYVSWLIGDVSQGQDATPLWIPQLAMAAGTVVFALSLTDRIVRVLAGAPVEMAATDRLLE